MIFDGGIIGERKRGLFLPTFARSITTAGARIGFIGRKKGHCLIPEKMRINKKWKKRRSLRMRSRIVINEN